MINRFLILLIFIVTIILIKKGNANRKEIKANSKGQAGEAAVNAVLKRTRLPYFHDTLVVEGQYSNQFDHIVVLQNNTLLVIETKNKSGNIRIPRNPYEQWEQLIGNTTHHFYSPVAQNQGHLNMLDVTLKKMGYNNIKLESVVVFTDKYSKLIDAPTNVIKIEQLESYINRKNKKKWFNKSKSLVKSIKKIDQSNNKKLVNRHIRNAMSKQK